MPAEHNARVASFPVMTEGYDRIWAWHVEAGGVQRAQRKPWFTYAAAGLMLAL
jgi:hypothetical protein